jgi:hypothetical protein
VRSHPTHKRETALPWVRAPRASREICSLFFSLRSTGPCSCAILYALAAPLAASASSLGNRVVATVGDMRLGYVMSRYVADEKQRAFVLAACANLTCWVALLWNVPGLHALDNAQWACAAGVTIRETSRTVPGLAARGDEYGTVRGSLPLPTTRPGCFS